VPTADRGAEPAEGLSASEKGITGALPKALRLLDTLAGGEALGAAELARRVGTTRATAHRVARILASEGWLRQGPDARYRLGPRAAAFALRARGADLRSEVLAELGALRSATSETVQLTRRVGADVVYVEQLRSPQPVLSLGRVGERVPIHCVSGGLAILAAEDEPVRSAILAGPLSKLTEATVTDPDKLRAELAEIAERGWAVNLGRCRLEVGGAGAAVLGTDGRPLAAVSVCVPRYRLERRNLAELGTLVMATAEVVGSILALEDDAGSAWLALR